MTTHKAAILALCLPLVALASEKQPPAGQAANDSVAISATLYQGKDAVRELLGSDLGGYFLVVKVEMTPKGAKPLAVDRDDFLLRSYNDGQKCQPYAPSQIAGRAALAVVPVGGGEVRAQNGGPVFGAPGVGGMPQRLPGNQGTVGSATSGTEGVDAKVNDSVSSKDDPLLKVLKAKILPEKRTSEPLSGLLYFSLEGKHKPKDMALQYKTPSGVLSVSFRTP
jgi:hypothetical protein